MYGALSCNTDNEGEREGEKENIFDLCIEDEEDDDDGDVDYDYPSVRSPFFFTVVAVG